VASAEAVLEREQGSRFECRDKESDRHAKGRQWSRPGVRSDPLDGQLAVWKRGTLDALVELARRRNGVVFAHRPRLAEDVDDVNEGAVGELDLVRLERRSLVLGLRRSLHALCVRDARDFELVDADLERERPVSTAF